ncbi:hypothetical protein GCM10017673_57610 [Streptosporangium violaceochromogenes]|nr:hypothetical protein GCM10017673_57610 [Streptosporangium violaceochromogenes]
MNRETTPAPWPTGENPAIRDAYDQMLAQDPRCEHGKKPGVCRATTCRPGGTR